MRNNLLSLLLWIFCLSSIVNSCRHDSLKESNPVHYASLSSKFQIMKLSEIPNVTKYIQHKTGRSDLSIPVKNKISNLEEGKSNIDFANLESSFILKKEEEDCNYYVFNLTNTGNENTIYNFEVKEVGEEIVYARVLEYISETPYGEKPAEVIRNFSGKINAYGLDENLIGSVTFANGQSPCGPDPNNPPSSGGANPAVGIPPSGTYPSNPGNSSWPGIGSSNYPEFPSGGDPINTEGCTPHDPLSIKDYGSLELMTDGCIFWFQGVFNPGASKLTAPCNDGSGVVLVTPNGEIIKTTPCDKTKALLQKEKIKTSIANIKIQAKKALADLNEGEIGHREQNDGNIAIGTSVNNGHGVDYGDKNNSKGGQHNHTLIGIKMHSPGDINELLGFVKVQPTNNIGDAYHGMIGAVNCSTCPDNVRYIHYIIRFSGTYQQAINYMFDDDTEKAYEKLYREIYDELTDNVLISGVTNPYVNSNGGINSQGLEKLFFDTIKNMNLQNKISLQRVDDNGTTQIINNITLDANFEPKSTPCL